MRCLPAPRNTLDLFQRHGFQQTKVAEICDGADVAHKTFFNHFPSKLHLLREIAHQGLDQLLVDIENVRKEQPSTPDRLLQFFRLVALHTADAGPTSVFSCREPPDGSTGPPQKDSG